MPRSTPSLALALLCLILVACQPSREEQRQFLRDYYVEHKAELEPRKALMDQYWARSQELRAEDLAQPLILGDRPAVKTEYPRNAVLAYDGRLWAVNIHKGGLDTPAHQLERGLLHYERKNLEKLRLSAERELEEHLSTRYLAAVKDMDRLDASTTDDFEMEEGRISAIGIAGGFARAAVLVFDLEEEVYLGCKQFDVQVAEGTEVRAIDIQGSLEQQLSKTIAERAKATVEYHKDPAPPAKPDADDEVEDEAPAG